MPDSPPPPDDVLIAASRAVTIARLLSGLVHEINNALLVISGTVEVLGGRSDLPPQALTGLERIRRQTERTAASINQVTAFSRAPLDTRAPVNLTELTRASVELRRFAATRAGLSLEFTGEGAPALVNGNAGLLQQAILNLIVTAEQALAGTRGRIDVAVETPGEWAAVSVTDNRPESARHSASRFEPFAGRSPADLSGLGLFAARAIVASHGGALEFTDGEAGTQAVMRVPVLAP